ncbi:ATP-binding protein [Anaerococcus sp. AGMB00486]|uniref:ATP-binding protein n=2 Tax=Anaerococcus TaxID=165779 RepID=A0ABX2N9E7_9FIRM|nr:MULTISPECIES: ATP-binding protein [Anaerococcus]MSS78476.1 chromosomal replication initiator DnaA [Anaerococcus porci]NVF11332.1 ATP-binding protein [Anaerococcus faecalis]
MDIKDNISRILENRRIKDKEDLQKRKEEIYEKFPRVKTIDNTIKAFGFKAASMAYDGFDVEELKKRLKELEEEKQTILLENFYPKDYLKIHYHCNICKDTGFIGNDICRCRRQLIIEERYSQSNIKNLLQRENFRTFNPNLYSKNLYKDYPISPYENIIRVGKDAKAYINSFDKSSTNLYIFGDVGRGKTFLINSIAKELLDRNFSVVYMTATKIFSFMNDYLYAFSERKEFLQEEYDLIFKSDLLIIDDLGSENDRNSNESNLFDIVNDRIINKKSIIFSSNYSEDELREIYGERIFSRIMGSSHVIEIYGDDLRLLF